MILWEECKEDFCRDGSLRDIYVTETSLDDWRALYPFIRDYPGAEYLEDGVVRPPPATVDQVFSFWTSGHPMLRFRVGSALIVFHFFSTTEIECDFDPNEIASQADLDELVGFVRRLGDATHKRVVITPENSPDLPFIKYEPINRAPEYCGSSAK